jgi:hypothetical protein
MNTNIWTSKWMLQPVRHCCKGVLAMQITEKELIEIINEEIDHMIENDEVDEGVLDRLKAKTSGALSSAGSQNWLAP